MKFKQLILVIMCFISVYVSAQEEDGSYISIKLSSEKNNENYFHLYNPPFKAKIIYKDTLEAVNKYPEQLMSSIMSENSEALHNYNNLKKTKISNDTKERFKRVKKLNKDKNYFELIHKFTFIQNGQKFAIVKFNLIIEEKEKPIKGAYTLIFDSGRWKKTTSPFGLTLLHLFFKSDKLAQIFKGQKTEDELVNAVIDKVYDDDVLNMDKLETEFKNWSKNKNTAYINHFINIPNWK